MSCTQMPAGTLSRVAIHATSKAAGRGATASFAVEWTSCEFIYWLVVRREQDEQFFLKTRAKAKKSTNATASNQA